MMEIFQNEISINNMQKSELIFTSNVCSFLQTQRMKKEKHFSKILLRYWTSKFKST